MKQTPRYKKNVLLLAGTLALAAAVIIPTARAAGLRHGTDILHFMVRKAMTNAGVVTDAAGLVDARRNIQGNANRQNLDIRVKGLDSNTPYQLLAAVNGDPTLVAIGQFSTDGNGRATVRYRQLGNGQSLGRGKLPLPAQLDPVTSVDEIVVANGSAQAVLTADLRAPDKLQYLIKRFLSTDSVEAILRLKANKEQTQIRLLAVGLTPTSDYRLALNGAVVLTNTTDDTGRLLINSVLEAPLDILAVHSLELLDSNNAVVLSTTLP